MNYDEKGDSYYLGAWEKDKRHGKGKMVYDDGTIFEGNFEYDDILGQGQAIKI